MKPVTALALLAMFSLPLAADSDSGIVPRSAPTKYAAHAEASGAAIGATLLSPKDVHKNFHTDLNACCRVVEVALYPPDKGTMDIDLRDFVLRVVGTEMAVKASGPVVVVGLLLPPDPNSKTGDIRVVGEAHIGLESESGPYPGQRTRGVETGGGIGVGNMGPDGTPNASSTSDHDRYLMEQELNEKSLPNDQVSKPAAGYLYFPLPKDNRKAVYQLEYTLNGQPITLKLN